METSKISTMILKADILKLPERTGFLTMLAILKIGKMTLIAREEDVYRFTISISAGEIHFDQIVEWLVANTEAI